MSVSGEVSGGVSGGVSGEVSGAELVERALALSRADGCVVIAGESSTVNLRWADNSLTTNGATRGRSLTVISVVGRSFGVQAATLAEPGLSDPATLAELVHASETAAREADPAEDYAELVGGEADPDFATPAEPTSTSVLSGFAADLGEAFGAARGVGRRLYGFAEHGRETTWLGSSTGLRRRHVQPAGSVEWTAKQDLGGPAPASTWHGQATRDFTDVSVPATVDLLSQRLAWSRRTIELPAGRYETLLPPTAVADLLIYMYWSAAARDAAEGRTVFRKAGGGTRIGDQLGRAGLTLASDPAEPGLEVAPFVVSGSSSSVSSVFDNGLGTGRTTWIDDGRLAALLAPRAVHQRYDVPQASYVDNLILDGGGSGSVEDLGRSTKRGLLVTCLWYIREVDPETLLLTGLTRDGVHLVEDGEVVGTVNNFRFNESPVDLLGRFAEVGASEQTFPREWGDWFTWVRMPAVRVPDFNMSSVSPAS